MKIGVYICHCGLNIAGVIDIKQLLEMLQSVPEIEVAKDIQFMCSDSGQESIIEDIKEHDLDRILVAACTPKLHETTFRQVLEKAGLNPYVLEIVNIREQCSWVHMENPQVATRKAYDLIKMGIGRLSNLLPLQIRKTSVVRDVLVIGGGVAGIEAALNLADSGYHVFMIEKEPTIGGKMALFNEVFPTNDCSICVLGPKMTDVQNHPNIDLYTLSEVTSLSGNVGNFQATVTRIPRYISEDKCKGCIDECSRVCPVAMPSRFDQGMGKTKAINIPIPQAVPPVAVIDPNYCVGCGLCVQACPSDAVEFDQKAEEINLKVGAIIVATGYDLFDPRRKEEYGYGVYPDVLTNMELERLLNAAGPTRGKVVCPSSGNIPSKVAFIQCVGSRDESVGNPYCSRVCCMSAMKNAQLLKERYPDIEITIHYIDIRASGEMYEEYYTKTQSMGINFVRGKVAEVIGEKEDLLLRYEDTLECTIREDPYDMVILSTGMEANKDSDLIRKLKVTCREDRFVAVAHPKMRPVDSHINGIFVAGCVSGPKEIQLSIAQGAAAAARAVRLLEQGELKTDPLTAFVNHEKCIGCGVCTEVCDYGNITMQDGKAVVDEISCSGCGTCSASCPADAIYMNQYSDAQIYAQIDAALEVKDEFPLIIAFLCNWCSYAAADLAGTSRIQYPTNVRIIKLMCAGGVDPDFVLHSLEKGADGIMIAGCRLGECHYVNGNYHAATRMRNVASLLEEMGLDPRRLRVEWISASEGEKFAHSIENFVDELSELGPVGSELPEVRDE